MTKKEAMRLNRQSEVLQSLGFTEGEAEQLRRISMTLHRWHERECNGEVQRGDDGVARGYRTNARFLDPNDPRYWYRVADRETGALKRLAGILAARNSHRPECNMLMPIQPGKIAEHAPCSCGGSQRAANPLKSYIQGDPRGAALYILRPGDVPAGEDAGAYYSRGICVY